MSVITEEMKIEPCILVTDRLTVDRGVRYYRQDISEQRHDDGSEDASWLTDRHYRNRDEAKEADRVYAKARQKIRSVCLGTELGFVCPVSKESELEIALVEAQQLVEDANSRFTTCKINFRVLRTRIEPENQDGVSTLQETLRTSVRDIKVALMNFDPKKARETIYATKRLVDVLSDPDAKKELKTAREDAKSLAGEIVKLVKEFDGHAKNAMASAAGEKLMERATATWNF